MTEYAKKYEAPFVTDEEMLDAMTILRDMVLEPDMPGINRRFGICMNARLILNAKRNADWWDDAKGSYAYMTDVFQGWSKHSGHATQPIPVLDPNDRENGAVITADEQGNKSWDAWGGGYKDLRLDLIDYSIEKIKERIRDRGEK